MDGIDLDTLTVEIEEKTRLAIKQTAKITNKTRKNGGLPYWSNALERLKKQTRARRKSYQAARDPTIRQRRLQIYRETKINYESELEKARKNCWEKYIQQNINLDPWGVPYKLVNQKIKSPTTLSTVKKEDGSMTTTWRETVHILLEKLIPEDNLNEDLDEHKVNRMKAIPSVQYPNLDTNGLIVENEEVETILRNLKLNKAPGPDQLKAEIFKNNRDIWVPYLARLFTECFRQKTFPKTWKKAKLIIFLKDANKDKTNTKSYRPICLLNQFSKMFEKVIINRINKHRPNLDECKLQYGFRKKRSTEDAINRLLCIAEREENQGRKYVLSIFVDITGAFDHLWWPALLGNVKKLNVPKYIWEIIFSYLKDREVYYEASGEKVQRIPTRGCPQGSVCGPIFWDLVIDPCLQELDMHQDTAGVVAYADDLAILISADSRRELELKSKNVITTLSKWCISNKLSISTDKTKYLLMKGKLIRDPTIKLNGKNIKRVKTYKYLGIHLDEGQTFTTHINNICQSGLKTVNRLITLALGHYKIPIKTIKLYYKVIIIPIISYGASVWSHRLLQNKALAAKIDRVQRKILLRMTGAYKTAPNDSIIMALGVTPLHLEVVKRGMTYWIRRGNQRHIWSYIGTPISTTEELETWIIQKWQQDWNSSITGRRLHQLLPSVEERLELAYLQPGRGLMHFLTGHGPYKNKLFQLARVNSRSCECGEEIDSPEHKIFECSITEELVSEERRKLQGNTVHEIIRDKNKFEILNKITCKISNHYITKFKNTR